MAFVQQRKVGCLNSHHPHQNPLVHSQLSYVFMTRIKESGEEVVRIIERNKIFYFYLLIDLRDDEDANFLCTSGYCPSINRH